MSPELPLISRLPASLDFQLYFPSAAHKGAVSLRPGVPRTQVPTAVLWDKNFAHLEFPQLPSFSCVRLLRLPP